MRGRGARAGLLMTLAMGCGGGATAPDGAVVTYGDAAAGRLLVARVNGADVAITTQLTCDAPVEGVYRCRSFRNDDPMGALAIVFALRGPVTPNSTLVLGRDFDVRSFGLEATPDASAWTGTLTLDAQRELMPGGGVPTFYASGQASSASGTTLSAARLPVVL